MIPAWLLRIRSCHVPFPPIYFTTPFLLKFVVLFLDYTGTEARSVEPPNARACERSRRVRVGAVRVFHDPECVSGGLILLTRANKRSRPKPLLVHDPFCPVGANCLLGRCNVANTRRLHVLAGRPLLEALIDLECFPHRPSVPPLHHLSHSTKWLTPVCNQSIVDSQQSLTELTIVISSSTRPEDQERTQRHPPLL